MNLCTSTGLPGDLLEVTDPPCARIMEGIKREMHRKCSAQDLALIIIRKVPGDLRQAGWGACAELLCEQRFARKGIHWGRREGCGLGQKGGEGPGVFRKLQNLG